MKHLVSSPLLLAALTLSGLCTLGCPGAQKIADTTGVTAPTMPALAGTFAADGCVVQQNADGTSSWTKQSVSFGAPAAAAPGTWSMDVAIYGDEACATKNATIHLDGTYVITGASTAVPGALDGTFDFGHLTITPHVDGMIALLQSYGCGKAPFAVNEAEDLLESGCKDLGYRSRAECPREFDIAKIDGTTVAFGVRPADNDMCSADKRPKAIAPVVFKAVP